MATLQAPMLRLSAYPYPELPLTLSEYKELFLAYDKSDVKAVTLGYVSEDVEQFGPATFFPPLGYKIGSPFIVGCHDGSLEVVKYLLKKFSYIIDLNESGYRACAMDGPAVTPLMAACIGCEHFSRNFEVVELLVDQGADVNAKGEDGSTALHHTCTLEVADYLVEHGANINSVDNKGYTPLMTCSVTVAEHLIEKGARVDRCGQDARTTLHDLAQIAIRLAKKQLIDVLLSNHKVLAPSATSNVDGAASEASLQKADCPLELKANALLVMVACSGYDGAAPHMYNRWMEALEYLEGITLTYPPPAEEYGGRVEVRSKAELNAIWGNGLEVALQHAMILERCLGGRTGCVLLVGWELINGGTYVKEGEAVVRRAIRLEEDTCHQILSQPQGSVHFSPGRFDSLKQISFSFIARGDNVVTHLTMLVKFGLLALKSTVHLDEEPIEELLDFVMSLFYEFTSSLDTHDFDPSILSLAKEFVSEYLYNPEGTNLLCHYVDLFFMCPLLLELLLQVGGDAAINDIVDRVPWMGLYCENESRHQYYEERTLLHRVLKGLYEYGESEEIATKLLMMLLDHGAYIGTTNIKGLTLFSPKLKKYPIYDALRSSSYLPLSLFDIAVEAVVRYGLTYHCNLPRRIVKCFELCDRSHFRSLEEYFW